MPRGAVLCIAHGGGPLPLLNDPAHAAIAHSLRTRTRAILGLNSPATRPRALAVVTAHWRTPTPTVSTGAHPPLLYDYQGFPAAAYSLTYPAPGSTAVAEEVRRALDAAGLSPVGDGVRGWDHGVFVPLLLANPAADVPVVQVSVMQDDDAAAHLRMGAALGGLREAGVAVVGSGFASLHNMGLMRGLMAGQGSGAGELVAAFNRELIRAMEAPSPEQRAAELVRWREWPGGWSVHPRGGAEHFMPLLVCAGAVGEDEVVERYKDELWGVDIWSFYSGAHAAVE